MLMLVAYKKFAGSAAVRDNYGRMNFASQVTCPPNRQVPITGAYCYESHLSGRETHACCMRSIEASATIVVPRA